MTLFSLLRILFIFQNLRTYIYMMCTPPLQQRPLKAGPVMDRVVVVRLNRSARRPRNKQALASTNHETILAPTQETSARLTPLHNTSCSTTFGHAMKAFGEKKHFYSVGRGRRTCRQSVCLAAGVCAGGASFFSITCSFLQKKEYSMAAIDVGLRLRPASSDLSCGRGSSVGPALLVFSSFVILF